MAKEPKVKHTGMNSLTKKQRSALAKQAVAGEDIGKNFGKVAEAAAKTRQYRNDT